MKLTKSETNNAIITTLVNVREHPNADRLKLATVLGTQVIVGLDAKDGDRVIYFDSNLALSHDYLFYNNLYSNKEMNFDPKAKPGFFGKSGRVKAQRFRGEVSNGYAVELGSLSFIWYLPSVIHESELNQFIQFTENVEIGQEFTHIQDREICRKYFVKKSGGRQCGTGKKKKKSRVFTNMFWKHWDTKQLMRETDRIVPGILYVEEKLHGTSGRTAHVLFYRRRKRWQFWKSKVTSFWKVVSGTRRVDGVKGHMREERRDIHEKLAPHVRKGEELYYEIIGYSYGGKVIQSVADQQFVYGCVQHCLLPYKVVLYRVTITTEDGYRIDLDRDQVYRRADELGLEKPYLLRKCQYSNNLDIYLDVIMNDAIGDSALDPNTMKEGVVVWFKDCSGNWICLKHKSEEFLLLDSRNKDKGGGDVEDEL